MEEKEDEEEKEGDTREGNMAKRIIIRKRWKGKAELKKKKEAKLERTFLSKKENGSQIEK